MNIIRKFTRKLVPFTLLFAALCLFTACPDDDNINSDDLLHTLQKYKWKSGDNVEFNEYDTWAELTNDVFIYYFISDTEGVLRHHHKWIDSSTSNNEGRRVDNIFFSYSVNGNSVTIRPESGSSNTLTYDGTNLKGSGETYHPVTPSAGDWEQIRKLQEEHQFKGDYDFDYTIGWDNNWPSYYESGKYTHLITLAFGVPKNTRKRGIVEFGIAINPENGTVNNKMGLNDDKTIFVSSKRVKGVKAVCFSGTLLGNEAQTWNTIITFESKEKTAKFSYCIFFITDSGEQIDGYSYVEQEYIPKNIGGGSDNPSGGSTGYKTCPDNNHPHMIDLGLPSGTLWACCNVGATTPEGYGNYYAWGETKTKSVYNWETYQYGSHWYNVVNIGSDIAGTSYDAATANWGAPWRMPTKAQCQELRDKCTSVWTTQNRVNGRKFIGPNGGTIFLPAAGYCYDDRLSVLGSFGHYWSSTLCEADPSGALYLDFDSERAVLYYGAYHRPDGQSVRPVR